MPTLVFELTLAVPLEEVWAFHDDPTQNLPALTPPELHATLDRADLPVKEGSRITLHHKGPLGRTVHWTVRITAHHPPHGVVFGAEARFTDTQESGPFAAWTHDHEFEALDAKTTRIVDRITYRLPLHPFSLPLDLLFVRPRLRKMFRFRHQRTAELLAPARTTP
jgi:ligand-binding SRPBCC domain-containing protein